MGNIYAPYAIQLAGGAVIGGVTRQDLDFGNEITAEALAGSPHARLAMKRGSRSSYKFSTKDVRNALALTGTEGAKVKTGATLTAFNIFEVKLDECGKPIASGTVHRKIACTFGCLIPRRLSVSAGQDAELDFEFFPLSTDGVTFPWVVTTIAIGSLPTLPTTEERYTIGPFAAESITIDRLTQLSIDFGLRAESIMLDSAISPTHLSLSDILPKIEFSGHAVDVYADSGSIGSGGLLSTHTNSVAWLRQRQAGGTGLFADTQEKHMKFTFNGLATVSGLAGDANKPKTVRGMVDCTHDGTNTPIVLTAQDNIAEA